MSTFLNTLVVKGKEFFFFEFSNYRDIDTGVILKNLTYVEEILTVKKFLSNPDRSSKSIIRK